MRLLAALGVSALTCGASAAPGGASGQATWMGGPGCGGARVNTAGHVSICSVPQLEYSPGAHVPNTCFQNWAEPVVLGDGQQTELDGFRCSSATNGITCTVVAGAGKGKGFRVNADEAVEVG